MFGPEFRRQYGADGANALLNYGYAILRSGAARAVMAAGLHPSFALAHINRGNAFGLVDDMMEPFRPQVDLMVKELIDQGYKEVTSEAKRELAGVLIMDMMSERGATPVLWSVWSGLPSRSPDVSPRKQKAWSFPVARCRWNDEQCLRLLARS